MYFQKVFHCKYRPVNMYLFYRYSAYICCFNLFGLLWPISRDQGRIWFPIPFPVIRSFHSEQNFFFFGGGECHLQHYRADKNFVQGCVFETIFTLQTKCLLRVLDAGGSLKIQNVQNNFPRFCFISFFYLLCKVVYDIVRMCSDYIKTAPEYKYSSCLHQISLCCTVWKNFLQNFLYVF